MVKRHSSGGNNVNLIILLEFTLLGFVSGDVLRYNASAKQTGFALFTGGTLLLLIAIWAIRDGYIGPKDLLPTLLPRLPIWLCKIKDKTKEE